MPSCEYPSVPLLCLESRVGSGWALECPGRPPGKKEGEDKPDSPKGSFGNPGALLYPTQLRGSNFMYGETEFPSWIGHPR